jgi:hypothetical protein
MGVLGFVLQQDRWVDGRRGGHDGDFLGGRPVQLASPVRPIAEMAVSAAAGVRVSGIHPQNGSRGQDWQVLEFIGHMR